MTRPPEFKQIEAEIERIRNEKEGAIKDQDFEKAAALRDGERVTYSAANSDKGWSATKAASLGSRVPPAERVKSSAKTAQE